MFYVYLVFAGLLVFLSYRSLRGGAVYLRYFKHELSRMPVSYMPFESVIVPWKGSADGLLSKLISILEQDYTSYAAIFVFGSDKYVSVPATDNLSHHESRH